MSTTVKVLNAKDVIATYKVNGAPVVIEAQNNVNYQLVNDKTGLGPQNIIAKREGNNLVIFLEDGDMNADIIIKDYYDQDGVSNLVVGQHENGRIYAYVPESSREIDAISMLAEEVIKPQALGGEELVAAAWAFNPWWIAGLLGTAAVVGAAVALGGSKDSSTAAVDKGIDAPIVTRVTLSDSISVVDGKAEPFSTVILRNNAGEVIGSAVTDANGNYTIETGGLKANEEFTVTAIDRSGKESPQTPFTPEEAPQPQPQPDPELQPQPDPEPEAQPELPPSSVITPFDPPPPPPPRDVKVTSVKNNFNGEGDAVTSTITGTAEPSSLVKVYKVDEDGNVVKDNEGNPIVLGSVQTGSNGVFIITTENEPLRDGKEHPVTATKQGVEKQTVALGDIDPPPEPIIHNVVNSKYDVEEGKKVPTESTVGVKIPEGAKPGDVLTLKDSTGEPIADPVTLTKDHFDSDGKPKDTPISFVITPALANEAEYNATLTDPAGNVSKEAPFVGDHEAPETITVTEVKNNFDEDGNPVTSTIKGTADPFSIVKVYKVDEDGNVVNDEKGNPIVLGSDTADEKGTYTITTENEPLLNAKKHPVTATDKYGNESTADADIVSALGDTVKPRQPEVTAVKNKVTDGGDEVSNVSGKIAEPKAGDIAYLYAPEDPTGEPIASDIVDPTTGEFTFKDVPRLVDGAKYLVTVKDTHGNESLEAEAIGDETPPPKPIVESVTNGDADENGNPDTLINVKIPQGAKPGDVLTLKDSTGKPIADPVPLTKGDFDEVDGEWVPKEMPKTFVIEPTLPNGNYNATLTDPENNVSPEEPFKGDTVAPKKVIVNKVVNEHDENGTAISSVIKGNKGAAEPKSIVKVYDVDPTSGETKTDEHGNPIVIGEATVMDDGSYTITTNKALEHDKNHPVVSVDKHANISGSADALGDREAPQIESVKVVNNFDKDGNAISSTVSGKAEPGSTVTLYDIDDQGNIDKTKPLGSDKANAKTGEYTITTETPLKTADYPLVATDGYNNPNTTEKARGDIDPPPAVVVDKVVNQHDASGNPTKSVVTGKEGAAVPRSTVQIYDIDPTTGEIIKDGQGNPVVIGETKAEDDGSFKITTSKALVHEKNYPTVQFDDHGNVSSATDPKAQAPGDTEPPTASDLSLKHTFTEGVATSSTVTGKANKGDIVTVYEAHPILGTINKTKPLGSIEVTEDNGSFSITLTDKVLESGKNYSVIAKDTYNNEGKPAPLEGDTTAPPEPIIDSVVNSQYQVVEGRKAPTESTVGVKIPEGAKPGYVLTLKDSTGEPIADSVTLTEDHFDSDSKPKDEPINFVITPALVNDAKYNATLTDTAGNVSDEAPFNGDHEAPPMPTLTKVVNNYDHDENQHQVGDPISSIVTGTAEKGSVVTIYDRDEQGNIKLENGKPVVIGKGDANKETGIFSITTSKALENLKEYPFTATDSHGNESEPAKAPGDTEDPRKPEMAEIDDRVPVTERTYPALVNNGKSQFNGTAPSPDTQKVYLKAKDGTILASSTVDANGGFKLTVTKALPPELRQKGEDPYILKEDEYEIITEDKYLNESFPIKVRVDVTTPKSPTVDFQHDPNGGQTKVSGKVDLPSTNEQPRGVTVALYKIDPATGELEWVGQGRTNEHGEYMFRTNIEDGVEYIAVSIDDQGNTSNLDPNDTEDPPATITGDKTGPTKVIESKISNTFNDNDPTTDAIGTIVSGKVNTTLDPSQPRQEVPKTVMLLDEFGSPITNTEGNPITAEVEEDGSFTFSEVNPALVNAKKYNIVGVDEQGNHSVAHQQLGDTQHPTAPTFTASTVKGDDGSSDVTQITASIEPNGKLALLDDNGTPVLDSNNQPIILTANANGEIVAKLDRKLSSGNYKSHQTDQAGNQSSELGTTTIKSTPPDAPVIKSFVNGFRGESKFFDSYRAAKGAKIIHHMDEILDSYVTVSTPLNAKPGDLVQLFSLDGDFMGDADVEVPGEDVYVFVEPALEDGVPYYATITNQESGESERSDLVYGDLTPPVIEITGFVNPSAKQPNAVMMGTTDAPVGSLVVIKDQYDASKVLASGIVIEGEPGGLNKFMAQASENIKFEEEVEYFAEVLDEHDNPKRSEPMLGDDIPYRLTADNFTHKVPNDALTGTSDAPSGTVVKLYNPDGEEIGTGTVQNGKYSIPLNGQQLETGKIYSVEISDGHNITTATIDGDNRVDVPVVKASETDGSVTITPKENGDVDEFVVTYTGEKRPTHEIIVTEDDDGNFILESYDGKSGDDLPEDLPIEVDSESGVVTAKEGNELIIKEIEEGVYTVEEKKDSPPHNFTVKKENNKWSVVSYDGKTGDELPNDLPIEVNPQTGVVTIPQDSVKDKAGVTVTASDEKGNSGSHTGTADYDTVGEYEIPASDYIPNSNESAMVQVQLPENALRVVIKYYDETGEYMHDETHQKSIASSQLRTLVLTRATDQDEWTWDVEATKAENNEDYPQLVAIGVEDSGYEITPLTELSGIPTRPTAGKAIRYISDKNGNIVDKPITLGESENSDGERVPTVFLPDSAVRGGSDITVEATNPRHTEKGEAVEEKKRTAHIDNDEAQDNSFNNYSSSITNGKLRLDFQDGKGPRNMGLKLTFKDEEEQVLYFHRVSRNANQKLNLADPSSGTFDPSDWLEMNPLAVVRGNGNYKLDDSGNFTNITDYGFKVSGTQNRYVEIDLDRLEPGTTVEVLAVAGDAYNQGFLHRDAVKDTIEIPAAGVAKSYLLQDENVSLADIDHYSVLDLSQVSGNLTDVNAENLATHTATIQLDNGEQREALIIKGEADDRVDLSDEVIANGSEEVQYQGESYNAYQEDGISILISQNVVVY